jgi:hypothetical protein
MKNEALNQTQRIKFKKAIIVNADGLALKTIYTAGSGGGANPEDAIVKVLSVVSTDTAARVLDLYVNDGVTDVPIGSVNIPALSGTNGTALSVDLLSGAVITGFGYDSTAKRVLQMEVGHTLKVAVQVAVTAGKQITVACIAEEF